MPNRYSVAELLTGVPDYSNGQIGEGAAYLFTSFAATLYDAVPRAILESDQPVELSLARARPASAI